MSSRCSGSETIGAVEHVLGRDLLAVARVGVVQPVPRVLHLHRGEVGLGRAVEVHPSTRVEREVAGVRHAEQPEAQPVRVVPPLPRVGREEALRGGVGADDEGDLAQPGEDAGARRVEGLGTGGARGVRRGDAGAVPAEGLRERRPGDVAGVPVAHRLAPHDEVDVLPGDLGVLQRRAGGVHAIADEVAAPLAPRVHADPEHGDVVAHWSASSPSSVRWPENTGCQRQMVRSPVASVCRVSTTSSTSVPTCTSATP